ncbi:MAG: hypothetical protein HQK99_04455 [Nitrospirae bacterium]|nr:hypothetical protein [Nitrospirota bacterium]
MKKSLLSALTVLVVVLSVGVVYAATITYNMPYFHTDPASVGYCIISNSVADNTTDLTVSFVVSAVGRSLGTKPSGTVHTFTRPLAAQTAKQFTLLGTTITDDTNTFDLATDIYGSAANTGINFSGRFTFTTSGTATCKDVLISCFQGTTTPKRNMVGYSCWDGTNMQSY